MSKSKHNKQQDSRERFNEILRQTNSLHRTESPFGNSGRLIAVMRHTESVTDADETVTIPRDEYNCLIVAKATLGLFIAARESDALPDYSIGKLLDMISNADADKSKDT